MEEEVSLREWAKDNLDKRWRGAQLELGCPCCYEGVIEVNGNYFNCSENIPGSACDCRGETLEELKMYVKRGKMIITYAGEM